MDFFDHRQEHIDDHMVLIQSNIDDMNPEFCSYVSDKLFEEGANDVYWIPIIMKRGRPGIMLNVLVKEQNMENIEKTIFRETTTLGLRYMKAVCHRLGRNFIDVDTAWGTLKIKVGYYKGEMIQFAPEFKQCEEIARKTGVPLKTVYDEVNRRFAEQRNL
jgi:uncharacterized protein (DUF111 family)